MKNPPANPAAQDTRGEILWPYTGKTATIIMAMDVQVWFRARVKSAMSKNLSKLQNDDDKI
jgi:hypothetical protein